MSDLPAEAIDAAAKEYDLYDPEPDEPGLHEDRIEAALTAAAPAIRAQAIAAERSDLRDAMEDVLDECARCPETSWERSLWDRLNPGEDFDAAITEQESPEPGTHPLNEKSKSVGGQITEPELRGAMEAHMRSEGVRPEAGQPLGDFIGDKPAEGVHTCHAGCRCHEIDTDGTRSTGQPNQEVDDE